MSYLKKRMLKDVGGYSPFSSSRMGILKDTRLMKLIIVIILASVAKGNSN